MRRSQPCTILVSPALRASGLPRPLHALRIAGLVALLTGMALLCPRGARASSQDLFGLGARGAAMGGAVVSNTQGFAAVYYNPAGLMLVEMTTFTVGYQRADYGLDLNGADRDVDAASNLLLGFNIPIPLGGFLENRLALGLGFILPTTSVLRAVIPGPEQPFFVLLEHRSQVVGIHAGLGIRVVDRLFVGVSVVALAELVGGLDVAPNDTGSLGTVVRDELVADYAPIAGVLATPWDWLSIGVTFHDQSESRYTFPITADLGSQFPIEVPRLDVSGVAQFDPMQVSSDVTVRPLPALELALGLTWKRWSTFENPINNTTEARPPQDPPAFENTIVPRLGAEATFKPGEMTWQIRLGGFYEPTPVPEQDSNHNYLDNDRVGIGTGAGWQWRGLTVDLGVQLQLALDRTHTKRPELVRDPENAGLPEISHGGHVIVSGLELGVQF